MPIALASMSPGQEPGSISPTPPSRQGQRLEELLAALLEYFVYSKLPQGRASPNEVGSITPHVMQHDRQLPRHGDLGFLEADAFPQRWDPTLSASVTETPATFGISVAGGGSVRSDDWQSETR